MHLVAFPPYLSRLPYDRAASAFIISYLSWTSPVAGFDRFVRDTMHFVPELQTTSEALAKFRRGFGGHGNLVF